MNTNTRHPDPELFDQLHAGLLDDRQALKTQLEAHLQECRQCQQASNWKMIADHTVFPAPQESRLDALTRAALYPAPRPIRRWLPIAAAASVIALLSAALIINQPGLNTPADTGLQAQTEPANMYEDLDFYLWMADHNTDSNQREQTNDRQG